MPGNRKKEARKLTSCVLLYDLQDNLGAQWLSGRVPDSRPMGRWI